MTGLIEITCMPVDMNDIMKSEAVVEVESVVRSSTTVYDNGLEWTGDDGGGEDGKFEASSTNSFGSSRHGGIKEKSRSDIVSQELGQYLLKGYKMLAETCSVCGCILMQDNRRQNHCIGCNLDKSNAEVIKASKSPPEVEVQPSIEAIPLRRDDGPVRLTEINSVSSEDLPRRCMVQGVDVSPELQRAVRSLKEKLVRLSAQLETITDHQELADCLTSMTTTVSVLEKIKKI